MSLRRIADLPFMRNRCQLAVLLMLTSVLLLHGCAGMRDMVAKSLPLPGPLAETIEQNDFVVAKDDDVIGRLAVVRLKKGDTLPDVARHFSLGINSISAANPGVDMWVPEPGTRILLPLSFILPESRRKGIVINLAAMRLFHFKEGGELQAVSTYPVGVGTEDRPTPMGRMHIRRKKVRPTWYVPASIAADHRKKGDPLPPRVPPGPLNPLGEYALYLSRASYLVHGTNKPASIGLRATNGCIRLYPEDIRRLFEDTPVKAPVNIVDQPYLVGRRGGVVYLEVHSTFAESKAAEREKAFAKLKNIDRKSGYSLDWQKVEKVMLEARGIPVPVSGVSHAGEKFAAQTVRLRHPGELYGKPQLPELRTDAWYVLAAILQDKVEARRLAAIINHQGPPIPARVLSSVGKHRVIAGPFNKMSEAREAAKRLKIDLEIDAILVEPVRES